MAGLVPAIHVFVLPGIKDVDARDPSTPRLRRATNSLGRRSFSEDGKRGHDDSVKSYPALALQMASFVALLRAVNVGSTGKLPMTELKAMCAELGFTSVRTYIASGNVVFASRKSETAVKAALEKRLAAYAEKPVGVMVRSAEEMAQVSKDNPFPTAAPNRTMAIFLDAAPPRDALAAIRGSDYGDSALNSARRGCQAFPSPP